MMDVWDEVSLKFLTAQKMNIPIKNLLSKCDQICRKLLIWSHLQKKFLTGNFTFGVVTEI